MARTARTTRPVDTDKPRPPKPWYAATWLRAIEQSEGQAALDTDLAACRHEATDAEIAAMHPFRRTAALDHLDMVRSGAVRYEVTDGRTFSWGACDMVPCWHIWKVER
jgi:hypothetical protein